MYIVDISFVVFLFVGMQSETRDLKNGAGEGRRTKNEREKKKLTQYLCQCIDRDRDRDHSIRRTMVIAGRGMQKKNGKVGKRTQIKPTSAPIVICTHMSCH